ncbi:MAG: glycosyltransferase, partial [Betaproteobacteria bacterium]|nr:glycosyltransferase [Betaproteobacteria bacterium]
KLVFVGDGPMLEQLKVDAPDAIFAGFRTGEDLAAHYASADMFMFASLTETFGNVTIEAMASGLPIVAFNHAAAGEIRRDSDLQATPMRRRDSPCRPPASCTRMRHVQACSRQTPADGSIS